MKDLTNFVKDRDEALLSLDKEKILNYMEKYGIPYKASSDEVFWSSIHKAIMQLKSATTEERLNSVNWLIDHGFMPTINNF